VPKKKGRHRRSGAVRKTLEAVEKLGSGRLLGTQWEAWEGVSLRGTTSPSAPRLNQRWEQPQAASALGTSPAV
jgi:hypothetical protein